MITSLLDLISTPMPVLNSLGLNLKVGLSSDDPVAGRSPSESYEAYLSIYSPRGELLERQHLGQIPPNRRRLFDISAISRKLVPSENHLVVAHRIPSRLAPEIERIEDPVEIKEERDYSMFRGLVEYSFPEGGNGSVIYETPPRLNAGTRKGSSNTLSFTSQTVLSDLVKSYMVLIHYSVNPSYDSSATFGYTFNSFDGEIAHSDTVTIAPFGIHVLDVGSLIPANIIQREKDQGDGLAAFNFVGYSEDASFMVLIFNVTPSIGSVALEHTHPAQSYLFPGRLDHRRDLKSTAQGAWKRILSAIGDGR
jgi:hypothetical protein